MDLPGRKSMPSFPTLVLLGKGSNSKKPVMPMPNEGVRSIMRKVVWRATLRRVIFRGPEAVA